MSASTRSADIAGSGRHFRKVPLPDSCTAANGWHRYSITSSARPINAAIHTQCLELHRRATTGHQTPVLAARRRPKGRLCWRLILEWRQHPSGWWSNAALGWHHPYIRNASRSFERRPRLPFGLTDYSSMRPARSTLSDASARLSRRFGRRITTDHEGVSSRFFSGHVLHNARLCHKQRRCTRGTRAAFQGRSYRRLHRGRRDRRRHKSRRLITVRIRVPSAPMTSIRRSKSAPSPRR